MTKRKRVVSCLILKIKEEYIACIHRSILRKNEIKGVTSSFHWLDAMGNSFFSVASLRIYFSDSIRFLSWKNFSSHRNIFLLIYKQSLPNSKIFRFVFNTFSTNQFQRQSINSVINKQNIQCKSIRWNCYTCWRENQDTFGVWQSMKRKNQSVRFIIVLKFYLRVESPTMLRRVDLKISSFFVYLELSFFNEENV